MNLKLDVVGFFEANYFSASSCNSNHMETGTGNQIMK